MDNEPQVNPDSGKSPGAKRAPRTRRAPVVAAVPAVHGRRVLVVEDERTIRQSIAGYLEDAGYAVDEAENGAEGLEKVRKATPDVVVLDLLMPIMGGRAFVAALRQEVRFMAVPVVLLSAAHDLSAAAEDLQPRASLAKPVDLDVLLAVVDRVSQT
jgi:CheY-like chemotaxis protein